MTKNLDFMLQENYFGKELGLEKEENFLEIIEEEDCLTLKDKESCKGYIQFHQDVDRFGYEFTFLDYTESYSPGEGHFSVLFDKFESIAGKQNSEYILLMVDFENDNAISIYQHFGFYSLGDLDIISENIDRIFMRKDLLFNCK
jgi:ribosomal protein S18 acetylase RimI-like enzyme